MKRIGFTTLACLLCSIMTLSAQDAASNDSTTQEVKKEKRWKIRGTPGINFSQNSFSNWIAGGASLTALNFDTKIYADYKKGNLEWKNYLNVEYGLNRQKVEGVRKIVDKIDFQTDISFNGPSDMFRYSGTLKLKSQFDDGYDYRAVNQWYLTSTFLAPGYITASVGMEYIGVKNLTVSFLPLTEKTTIVSEKYYDKKVVNVYYDGYEPEFERKTDDEDFEGEEHYQEHYQHEIEKPTPEQLAPTEQHLDSTLVTYGLKWRENTRFETGLKIGATYSIDNIFKCIGIKSRLEIFSAYTNFLRPDIDWEVWLSFRFYKNIAFNINCELLYDSDMLNEKGEAKVQFRNFMGIGLSYTFNN